jgi:hypothetical protein
MAAGCDFPSDVWTKPGVTHEQYMAEDGSCREVLTEQNFGVGPTTGANKKAYYEQCMKDHGYTKQGVLQEDHLHNPPGVLAPQS